MSDKIQTSVQSGLRRKCAAALGIYLVQIFHTLRDVQSLPAGSAEKLKVYLFHIRESMTAFGRAENRWYSILQSVLISECHNDDLSNELSLENSVYNFRCES